MERFPGSKDSHTHVLGGHVWAWSMFTACRRRLGHVSDQLNTDTLTNKHIAAFQVQPLPDRRRSIFFSWLCQAFKASRHQSANLYLSARPDHRAAGQSHRREYAESTPHKCLLMALLLVKTSLELELVLIELLRVFFLLVQTRESDP